MTAHFPASTERSIPSVQLRRLHLRQCIVEIPEFGSLLQLGQGLELDLPDPFPREVELAADLVQRLRLDSDAELSLQDELFPRGKALQSLLNSAGNPSGVKRRVRPLLEEVARRDPHGLAPESWALHTPA